MFVQKLNYYSFIIPVFLMCFSAAIAVLLHLKKVNESILWITGAIVMIVLTQCIQIIILPEKIYLWTNISALFFFSSVIFITHGLYLRLNIKTHWKFVLFSFILGQILLFYFTFIENHYIVRIALTAVTSVAIFANNLPSFVQKKIQHPRDNLLRLSLYLIVACIVFRTLILIIFYDTNTDWAINHSVIWAFTQFLSLICITTLVSILISCSIQDNYIRLNRDRNLDPLTGLMNRRALNEYIELQKLKIQHKEHAIILCDIDYFKKINDQYGHKIGDLALMHISDIMIHSLDKYSEVVRMGGEEFLILLHDVNQNSAIDIAEKIRKEIQNNPLDTEGHSISITASMGVTFFKNYQNFSLALTEADHLLYQAKNMGRNNVQWQL